MGVGVGGWGGWAFTLVDLNFPEPEPCGQSHWIPGQPVPGFAPTRAQQQAAGALCCLRLDW